MQVPSFPQGFGGNMMRSGNNHHEHTFSHQTGGNKSPYQEENQEENIYESGSLLYGEHPPHPFYQQKSQGSQHGNGSYNAMDRGVQSSLPSLASEPLSSRLHHQNISHHIMKDLGIPSQQCADSDYSDCERWHGSTTAGSWDEDRGSCSSDTCCSCSDSNCPYSTDAELMQQQDLSHQMQVKSVALLYLFIN